MEKLIEILGTSADAATIAIAIALLRHGTRITRLEARLDTWLTLQLANERRRRSDAD